MPATREKVPGVETSRYLECLAADYSALRAAATAAGMAAPVPSCPDWTVADLVTHTGEVYLHKATIMREQKWPDPWPPDFAGEEPLDVLDRGYLEVTAEFAGRPPEAPSPTWHEPDQTVRFWVRRMAQETVIHRIDAELAAGGTVTATPGDLAADGVDTIVVTAGPASWTVRPAPKAVTVTDGGDPGARALVSAELDAMLRWLWGRADDSVITVAGDQAWTAYPRRLLAAVTQ